MNRQKQPAKAFGRKDVYASYAIFGGVQYPGPRLLADSACAQMVPDDTRVNPNPKRHECSTVI